MASPTEEDMENIFRFNFREVQASTTEEELYRNLRAKATPQTKNALAAWFDAQDTVIDFMEKHKIIPNKVWESIDTITDIGELGSLKIKYSDFKRYEQFETDVNSRIAKLKFRPKPKLVKRPKVKKKPKPKLVKRPKVKKKPKPKRARPKRLVRYRWRKEEINYIKKHPTFTIKKLKKSKVLRRRTLNAIYLKRRRLLKRRRRR
jgi:hypothetical protein